MSSSLHAKVPREVIVEMASMSQKHLRSLNIVIASFLVEGKILYKEAEVEIGKLIKEVNGMARLLDLAT